jgi:glycosyltransferase involved in cell wall biosynthesis
MKEFPKPSAPIISIIMPTYNRSVFLRRAIESVFQQTLSDWELIIVDDASTDDTPGVIGEFMARDKRIVALRNDINLYPGISKILDRGLAVAKGEYIARLDDDDYWIDPDKLKKQYDFLENHPNYVVIGSGMVVVDNEGKELYRYLKKETDEEIRRTALSANPFSHTTVMFRAEIAKKVGGYGDWRYAEDWNLWLKMGKYGKFYNFQEYFAAYTSAGENKSFTHQRAQSRTILDFIVKYRRKYPGFVRGYLLNGAQYLYSFLPVTIRRPLQNFLVSLKRRAF